MANLSDVNIDTSGSLIYSDYSSGGPVTFDIPAVPGSTAITVINGASGPTLTFSGGASGYDFVPGGTTITLTVSNAATVRSSISAAKSGANSDINTFSALTGSSGWSAWTGSSDKTTHATYSGTASVGYVQAELQGAMDALKHATEFIKALVDTLLASGVLKV